MHEISNKIIYIARNGFVELVKYQYNFNLAQHKPSL